MRRPIGAAATVSLLFVGIGLLVLSPTYFAFFYEGAGTHSRVGALTRAVALSNQFDPGALVTLATPWPTSARVSFADGLFPSSDPSMTNIYMGLLIPVLAITALWCRPRSGWRWLLFGLALLGLAAAMGETLPLRGWLYDLFVPLRYFRHSGVFRLYFVVFISVLAILGGRELARLVVAPDEREFRPVVLIGLGLATVAVAATIHFVLDLWSTGLVGRRTMAYAVGWIIMAGVLTACWRLSASRRARVLPLLLVGLAAVDAVAVSTIARPTVMAEGSAVERWQDLDARHRPSLDLRPQGLVRVASTCDEGVVRCRRNDQLIAKYQSFDPYTTQRHFVHLTMLRDPVLQAVAVGNARVWFTDSASMQPATERAFSAFTQRAHAIGAAPMIVHEPAAMRRPFTAEGGELDAIAALPAALPMPATVLTYGTNDLTLQVEVPRAGWLMVADRWARSWDARVNGRTTPVHGANFIFRAVPVEAGLNQIEFAYHPRFTLSLLALSWGVLVAVLLASVRGGPAGLVRGVDGLRAS